MHQWHTTSSLPTKALLLFSSPYLPTPSNRMVQWWRLPAPGLFSCCDTQYGTIQFPDFACVTCSTVHGNLWHFRDRHRNQLTILIMCSMLPRNWFIWNTFTNNVACVFNKTPPWTFALSDASSSSCRGSWHHQPSSHRQRLAIASTPSSELSDYIYEPHLAFQPRPTPTLL